MLLYEDNGKTALNKGLIRFWFGNCPPLKKVRPREGGLNRNVYLSSVSGEQVQRNYVETPGWKLNVACVGKYSNYWEYMKKLNTAAGNKSLSLSLSHSLSLSLSPSKWAVNLQ